MLRPLEEIANGVLSSPRCSARIGYGCWMATKI